MISGRISSSTSADELCECLDFFLCFFDLEADSGFGETDCSRGDKFGNEMFAVAVIESVDLRLLDFELVFDEDELSSATVELVSTITAADDLDLRFFDLDTEFQGVSSGIMLDSCSTTEECWVGCPIVEGLGATADVSRSSNRAFLACTGVLVSESSRFRLALTDLKSKYKTLLKLVNA